MAASPSLSADIGSGVSIALKLTAGQAHDGRSAANVPDTSGDGDVLLTDRPYDSDVRRIEMAACWAWADIKPKPNRRKRPSL